MNFYKNHYGMVIASVIALLLSLIMAASIIVIDHLEFTLTGYIKNWGTCFLVITLTGMIFPMTDWAFAVCRKLKIKPNTLPHILIENLVACLFFNTTAALVLAAVNIFDNAAIEAAAAAGQVPSVSWVYWHTVAHDWPITFIIAYIVAFFLTKLAVRIATKAVGPLETKGSPQLEDKNINV